jgi:succinate dehydrogenase/fumarate reductase flavoprotein subunit
MSEEALVVNHRDVSTWDETVDVLVAGYGVSGACAALEAHRAGAKVLVVERASGGGGASALSSGIYYLGGGTAVQKACGYEDTPEDLYRFMLASCDNPDPSIVRSFCMNAVEHFNWLEAQGMPFERTSFKGKAVFLNTTECLFSTGSEKLWPYSKIARPAPRGHKVAGMGENAGAVGMNALLATCQREGVPAIYDSAVIALVQDDTGRITGARIKQVGKQLHIRARAAVVIATGNFTFNKQMLAEHVPLLSETCEPLGVPSNDGLGTRIGMAAGGAAQGMDGVCATASIYPPGQLIKGIIVNNRGQRFVAEDSYHGRTADFVKEQPDQAAYLIVDSEIFAYPEIPTHKHTLIDGWETVAEMEAGLRLPPGSLQKTMDEYNAGAARGEDPFLFKDKDWLKPLDKPAYAAFDISFNKSVYLFVTLGGLRTNADAQVLNRRATPIPGLYAVGAAASHIPQSGKGYASGMSLGPGSWFGRVAGKHAAAAAAVLR